jgi:hypothetical protein
MQTTPPPSKLQPALLGGVFMGVLSALPFVSYANACCCLWVLTGGLLAAWLLQQNYPFAITTGDGALVGLLAGFLGAIITTVIQAALAPVQRDLDLMILGRLAGIAGDIPPVVQDAIEQRRNGPALSVMSLIGGLIFMLIIGPLFSMLGGLLGAALFKSSRPAPPVAAYPPPPPVPPSDLPPAP